MDRFRKKEFITVVSKENDKAEANSELSPAVSQLSSHPEMETAYQDGLQSKQAYLGQL